MKKFAYLIKQISFSDVLKQNNYDKVYATLNKSETEVFPKTLKILIFSTVSFLISLYSAVNWLLFSVVSTITIFLTLLFYFRSPNFFKKASYKLVSYFFVQNTFIFYLSSLKITDNVSLNRILASVYILLSFVTAFYILRLKLLETIQTKYFPKNQALIKGNAMKFVKNYCQY